MAYNLNKTNGELLVTVLDGTTTGTTSADTFSLVFIGKNYPNYGQIEQRNFLRLLENGANDTSPLDNGIIPLAGELWFDTANKRLNVYDGSQFKPVGAAASASAPTNPVVGDLWWHTTTNQFKAYNGSTWVVIGPSYDPTDGVTGTIIETVKDVDLVDHKITTQYTKNVRTAIISQDAVFAPQTGIAGYPVIRPGINFGFGTGNGFAVAQTGTATEIINSGLNGDINIKTNTASVSTSVLTVNGSTGLITVLGNPTQSMGVATKSYVDNTVATLASSIQTTTNALATSIGVLNSNAAVQGVSISSLNSLKANLASPAFTGTPTAPTAPAYTNSTQIATTAFVDTAVNTANVGLKGYNEVFTLTAVGVIDTNLKNNLAIISANIGTLINNTASQATSISSLSLNKAALVSPAFTGLPTAPTAPIGSANTQIATTSFVQSAITASPTARWLNSYKYISQSAPTVNDGSNGDFWFQI